jgi:glutamate dehydrogenase
VQQVLRGDDLVDLISRYSKGVRKIGEDLESCLGPFVMLRIQKRRNVFIDAGAPADLALDVASLRILATAKEAVDVSEKTKWSVVPTARIQNALDHTLGLDKVRAACRDLQIEGHWDRMALQRISDALPAQQAALTNFIIQHASKDGRKPDTVDLKNAEEAVKTWLTPHLSNAERVTGPIDQFENSAQWSLAKLVLVGDALREFVQHLQDSV